ncbi:MAG: UDP-N-acetylmuramate dehydrogenase [Halomonas sp.]|nr:UDP-N-acetylmuramate dehydrogenase [Halomonas sp.]TVM08381.1 MAG: UDP-N-acetylmuramate dehydrogenase [Halomonas sp.]
MTPRNWLSEVDLSPANTLQLPSSAEYFCAPVTLKALQDCLRRAHQEMLPIQLLGGGSNVLLPEYLAGLVVHPALTQWWMEPRGDSLLAHVGAGVNWHALVMATVGKGLWGLENLALIPGSCGAAPVQNIGAYGVELADVLEAVEVMYLADGHLAWLSAEECAFGYRESIFKSELLGKVVITRLVLRLKRHAAPVLGYGDLAQRLGESPSSLDVANTVCRVRSEKLPDPAQLANAGSFFKNPLVSAEQARVLLDAYPAMPHFAQQNGTVKLAAGWLIDQCGLKGARFGAFGVHHRQALVLVHFGGGNRPELLAVAEQIAAEVKARFGVLLEIEPRLL